MADGTSFEIDIDTPAGSAESAAAAVARLAEHLTAAGAASVAASEAVKAGEAAYAQAERAADSTAKSLEKLGIAAEAQAGKLKAAMEAGDAKGAERAAAKLNALTMRQAEAAQKAAEAKTALDAQAASLDKLRGAATTAADAESEVAKSLDQTKKAAEAVAKAQEKAAGSGEFKGITEGAKKLGGPLGKLGGVAGDASEGFEQLSGSLGATGSIYVVAAAAIVALTTALIVGTAAALKWAIGLADANRSARLLSDGIAGSVAGGRELDSAIKSLEKRVPQTADELRSMAADLAKTGLKGQALTDALEGAALKAAELKWGPDFAKGAISADKLASRLKSNMSGLFGGLNIEGVLGGFSKLVDLFDETSITGKAIKVVFESLFQPILDGLAELAPKIVSAFIQFEIWVLKALIAIKPFGSTIMTVAKIFGALALAVVAAGALVVGILVGVAVAITGLVAGLIYLGATFGSAVIDVVKFGASILSSPGQAIDWLTGKFNEFMAFLSGLSLSEIGRQIIEGLANGIKSAGAAVLSAITGVVGGAVDAAKSMLGIASPSKVFAEIGANTAAGMASGVEGATGEVQGSLESMVAPPDAAVAEGGASAGGAGGGHTFQITINAGGGDGESIAAAVEKVITDLLEGDLTQAGGAVPA